MCSVHADDVRSLAPVRYGAYVCLSVSPQTRSGVADAPIAALAASLAMPNAFLVPLSKTAARWTKDWMERHTYFLPRYDDAGRMQREGHALVAEAGIACLMRRTYKSEVEPAPAGAYDFISYFECADADV